VERPHRGLRLHRLHDHLPGLRAAPVARRNGPDPIYVRRWLKQR
jgi:hypothetical protein